MLQAQPRLVSSQSSPRATGAQPPTTKNSQPWLRLLPTSPWFWLAALGIFGLLVVNLTFAILVLTQEAENAPMPAIVAAQPVAAAGIQLPSLPEQYAEIREVNPKEVPANYFIEVIESVPSRRALAAPTHEEEEGRALFLQAIAHDQNGQAAAALALYQRLLLPESLSELSLTEQQQVAARANWLAVSLAPPPTSDVPRLPAPAPQSP